MRPLMEILEDERTLMLRLDTVIQNMLRYPYEDAYELLAAKRAVINRELEVIRAEIQEYITKLLEDK